ncbi:MAG: extracellular solute-binding protein [Arcanobacterium sp.]|nr:extracellular solute-binding protein [Arcanobacterium sp.]MDY5589501.1 extracellular solute-binding protein [Arcanobacterium sp.]
MRVYLRKSTAWIVAALTAVVASLAGCTAPQGNDGDSGAAKGHAPITLTFRLWDDQAQPAYAASFKAFERENPDIHVAIEHVPWASYWKQIPLDIAAGNMADVYLMNSSNFAFYADAGKLVNISQTLGNQHAAWQKAVTDLYTRSGSLWGVPQLWDSIALFYNIDLVQKAGVDPTRLTWAPLAAGSAPGGGTSGATAKASGGGARASAKASGTASANSTSPSAQGATRAAAHTSKSTAVSNTPAASGDTLLPTLRALTRDTSGRPATAPNFDPAHIATYGFNAQIDMQAIYLDFLAEAGATYQAAGADTFAFASPAGEQAFNYLVHLVNGEHLAPPAAVTNTNGDFSRDLFLQGKLALFQSGPYNLKTIAEGAAHKWGIAPIVAGPRGRVSVVHGVAAVGNADSKYPEAVKRVLTWLGSVRGQEQLGAQGVAFPAAVEAQHTFVDYWAAKGVDVQVFIDAARGSYADGASGSTAPAPRGRMVNAGAAAAETVLKDILLGITPVKAGLQQAQAAGNTAMRE